MSAGKWNFIIPQGSTWDQYINLKDGTSTLIDLSKYTASMQIRTSAGGTLYKAVSCSIEPTSGSSTSGSIRLQLTHEDTAAFTFDKAAFDIEIASGSADAANTRYVERVLQGRIKLDKEVTT